LHHFKIKLLKNFLLPIDKAGAHMCVQAIEDTEQGAGRSLKFLGKDQFVRTLFFFDKI